MKLFCIIAALLTFIFSSAQDTLNNQVQETIEVQPNSLIKSDSIFVIVDEYPSYPGGNAALLKEIAQKLRYPTEAMIKGIEGKVYLKMIIERDGSIGNIEIAKEIGGGCGQAAVDAVRELDFDFTPAIEEGERVRVYFTLPIKYSLQGRTRKKWSR